MEDNQSECGNHECFVPKEKVYRPGKTIYLPEFHEEVLREIIQQGENFIITHHDDTYQKKLDELRKKDICLAFDFDGTLSAETKNLKQILEKLQEETGRKIDLEYILKEKMENVVYSLWELIEMLESREALRKHNKNYERFGRFVPRDLEMAHKYALLWANADAKIWESEGITTKEIDAVIKHIPLRDGWGELKEFILKNKIPSALITYGLYRVKYKDELRNIFYRTYGDKVNPCSDSEPVDDIEMSTTNANKGEKLEDFVKVCKNERIPIAIGDSIHDKQMFKAARRLGGLTIYIAHHINEINGQDEYYRAAAKLEIIYNMSDIIVVSKTLNPVLYFLQELYKWVNK